MRRLQCCGALLDNSCIEKIYIPSSFLCSAAISTWRCGLQMLMLCRCFLEVETRLRNDKILSRARKAPVHHPKICQYLAPFQHRQHHEYIHENLITYFGAGCHASITVSTDFHQSVLLLLRRFQLVRLPRTAAPSTFTPLFTACFVQLSEQY